jgi:hypothetical protein
VRERDDPFGDYGSGPRSKNRAAKTNNKTNKGKRKP